MERRALTESLVKLNEDDLLHVVQMIHDNKSEETYTKKRVYPNGRVGGGKPPGRGKNLVGAARVEFRG